MKFLPVFHYTKAIYFFQTMAVLHNYQVVRKRCIGSFYDDRPWLTLTDNDFVSLPKIYTKKLNKKKL